MQDASEHSATVADRSLPAHLSAVFRNRHKPFESDGMFSDFLSNLGHFDDQHSARHRPDSRNGLQDGDCFGQGFIGCMVGFGPLV